MMMDVIEIPNEKTKRGRAMKRAMDIVAKYPENTAIPAGELDGWLLAHAILQYFGLEEA